MSSTVRSGIAALAKVLLVLVGVPLALARLWLLSPLPASLHTERAARELSTWSHLLLLAVAGLWLVASFRLVRELRHAYRNPNEAIGANWTSRWAGELAGLLLLATSGTIAGATVHESPSPVVATASHASATRPSPVPVVDEERALALAIGALGALGLVRRARRLRRLAEVARAPGERLRPPSLEQVAYELLLEQFGDLEMLEWIETANRHLSSSADHDSAALEHIRLWRCSHAGIELLLDPPLETAPRPFAPRDGGRWWVLEPSSLRAAGNGGARAVPLLVPIGDDDDASYLVALRPGRRLGLLGSPADVDAVLAGIVLGLRTMPWAEQLEIELLGVEEPPLIERSFHLHRSSDATLSDLYADRARTQAGEGAPTRWRHEPLVVVGRNASTRPELLDSLSSELGIVVAGGSGTETLVLEDGGCLLSPFGVPLRPPRLELGSASLADALLASAGRSALHPDPVPPPAVSDAAGASGPVELVVLAPRARLVGVPRLDTDDERRVAALVGYLLTHERHASEQELARALFPHTRTARAERMGQLAALARRCLGEDPDGRSRLSPPLAGAYLLSPTVTGDWLRLRAQARRARTAPPEEAITLLHQALALIEGSPLSEEAVGFGSFRADGSFEELVADVVDAAHHLATLELATGGLAAARWALERGLLVEPFSEILARDALSLAEANGDPRALEATLEHLEGGLVSLGTEPSAATLALYDQLRRNFESSD